MTIGIDNCNTNVILWYCDSAGVNESKDISINIYILIIPSLEYVMPYEKQK